MEIEAQPVEVKTTGRCTEVLFNGDQYPEDVSFEVRTTLLPKLVNRIEVDCTISLAEGIAIVRDAIILEKRWKKLGTKRKKR